MRLLVHSCCADCLVKLTKVLEGEKLEITAYFYNPNIHPRAEYLSRLKAIKQYADENKVKLTVADWSPKERFEVNKNNFKKPERCWRCWQLRLKKSFEYAKKYGFEAVTTTLLTSHYQDRDKIEEIGKNLEKKYKIKFLAPKNIVTNIKTKGFYKQNYCGCCFSLTEAWKIKFSKI